MTYYLYEGATLALALFGAFGIAATVVGFFESLDC